MIYIDSNLKIRKGYLLSFFLFVAFLSGLKAQNYAIDFDGSNDHITTSIDADLQAMHGQVG